MPATSLSEDIVISWSSEVLARIEVGGLPSSPERSETPLMMLVNCSPGLGNTMSWPRCDHRHIDLTPPLTRLKWLLDLRSLE